MGIADPVLIQFQHKQKNYILIRGRETFYDPDTRELRSFDTVGEARMWSVKNLGVDPSFGVNIEPLEKPVEELPLFAKEEEDASDT